MNSLITSYGIDFTKFYNVVTSTNSLVAGSAALACYLKQEGIDPGYEPGDIDIWLSYIDAPYSNLEIFRDFILSCGFTTSDDILGLLVHYPYSNLSGIHRMITLINSRNQKVQLIMLAYDTPLNYIRSHFDLSVCQTWWDALKDKFVTAYPSLTANKKMLWMYTCTPNEKSLVHRIQKYRGRGFELIPWPCPVINMRDNRGEGLNTDEGRAQFANKTAFDTIELDDVNLVEHLCASEWNIILKVKDSMYAFNRIVLIDFMKRHATYIPELRATVMETPFHQSVHFDADDMLLVADYSIYELEYSGSIKYGADIKSLYNMKCYSIKDYINGSPSIVIYSPTTVINDEGA